MTKPSTSPWGLSTKRSRMPVTAGRLLGSIQCMIVSWICLMGVRGSAARWRWRTQPIGTRLRAARRPWGLDLGQLIRRGADRPDIDELAERGLEQVAAHRDRLSSAQRLAEAFGLRRRQAQLSAVLEHSAIDLAALAVQHRCDASAEGLLAAASSRRSEEHTSELQSPDHLVCR